MKVLKKQKSLILAHESSGWRNNSLDKDILRGAADCKVTEGFALDELGRKFVSDVDTLEAEIEKVRKSRISDEDKKYLIETLQNVFDLVQAEYEELVSAEEERVQQELEQQIELMQIVINEFDEQLDSLRKVTMEAASTDVSYAIKEAELGKQEFEKMQQEYAEQLSQQEERHKLRKSYILAKQRKIHSDK